MTRQTVIICLMSFFILSEVISAQFPNGNQLSEYDPNYGNAGYGKSDHSSDSTGSDGSLMKLSENTSSHSVDEATSVDRDKALELSLEEDGDRQQFIPQDDKNESRSSAISTFLKTWTLNKFWHKCLNRGVTWKTRRPFCTSFGLGMVGCDGCNPYQGDTICWFRRPILCINDQDIQRPDYDAGTGNFGFYYGWSGAFLNITPPIRGCYIYSKDHADRICKMFFGDCWRMADHHDGWRQTDLTDFRQGAFCEWRRHARGGWNFFALGNKTGSLNCGRFWVSVNNQPNAHCWDD